MQLIERLDDQARALAQRGFAEACDRPVTLRANTLKASADEIAVELDSAGVAYERVPWYRDAFVLSDARERAVWNLDMYQEGRVYMQSLSSMLPPLLLRPRAGADILDMCAAPGGKTSQIAALTNNAAHLTACEMSAPRAEKLDYNLSKLGATNVQVMRTDARRLDEFFSFDQILLDAPCTGTGTYRTGDERAEKRMTPQLLSKVTRSQKALLDRALTVLKPGGTLVYSTCSILPEENDEQVRAALKRHRDCKIAPIVLGDGEKAALDEAATDDVDTKGSEPRPVILERAGDGAFRLPALPYEQAISGTLCVAPTRLFEGFYVAVIQKAARK